MIGHNLDGSKRTAQEEEAQKDRETLRAFAVSPRSQAPVSKPSKPRALVLFSGGADSVMLLLLSWKLGREIFPLMFRYGQQHVEELSYGVRLLHKLNESLKIRTNDPEEVDISGAFENVASKIKGDQRKYPGVHEMHLPGRNGVFLTTAMGIAESHHYDEIWIGCDYSDRMGLFPDCYQEWIVAMDQVARSNGSRKLSIKAPLLGFAKEDVLAYLKAEGIDPADVYTGYQAPGGAK